MSNKVEALSIGEAGDGEEGEGQPSMEEGLTGEQKTDDNSLQLSGKHRLTAWLPWRWDYT